MNAIVGLTTLLEHEIHEPEKTAAPHPEDPKIPVSICWDLSMTFLDMSKIEIQ